MGTSVRVRPSCLAVLLWGCGPGSAGTSADADGVAEEGSGDASSTDGPETTTETSGGGTDAESESETDTTTGDLCEETARDECFNEVADLLVGCTLECACGGLDCMESCVDGLGEMLTDCSVTAGCREEWEAPYFACEDVCEAQREACQARVCGANDCEYWALLCVNDCGYCPGFAELNYSYEGSCDIALPGPVPPVNSPFVEIGSEFFDLFGTCDVDGQLEWVDEAQGVVRLCSAACEEFATVGAARVHLQGPPCD